MCSRIKKDLQVKRYIFEQQKQLQLNLVVMVTTLFNTVAQPYHSGSLFFTQINCDKGF